MQFLTDAGQYMIRFGDVSPRSRFQYTAHDETLHNHKPLLSTKQTHSGLQEMQQLRAAAEEVDLTCSVSGGSLLFASVSFWPVSIRTV